MKAESALKIGIAGLGVVGSEVARQILNHADTLAAAANRPIRLVAVNARTKDVDRGFSMDGIDWVDQAVDIAARKDIDVVVEMIGGSEGVALDLARASLTAGKTFVTANKAMLAHHGTELATLAEARDAPLFFEAAVAGGIPAVKTLREGLAGNRVKRIAGILNGTCNYILTTMEQTGRDFGEVLADAQRLGYAEAEPSFDVDGIDAAHKLTILAAIAFGQQPDFDAVSIHGIRDVSSVDFAYANQLGFRIKLVGVAEPGLIPHMQTCLLPLESQLAKVNGVLNAVEYHADPVGAVLAVGPGAGGGATSSAVLSDLIDIAVGRHTPPFGKPVSQLRDNKSIKNGNGPDRPYYVRLMVVDQPGVLASVTSVLQRFDISVEGLLQKGRAPDDVVALAMTTHETSVQTIRDALQEIEQLDAVKAKPVAMPILPVDMGA